MMRRLLNLRSERGWFETVDWSVLRLRLDLLNISSKATPSISGYLAISTFLSCALSPMLSKLLISSLSQDWALLKHFE